MELKFCNSLVLQRAITSERNKEEWTHIVVETSFGEWNPGRKWHLVNSMQRREESSLKMKDHIDQGYTIRVKKRLHMASTALKITHIQKKKTNFYLKRWSFSLYTHFLLTLAKAITTMCPLYMPCFQSLYDLSWSRRQMVNHLEVSGAGPLDSGIRAWSPLL